jgi:phage/plasmid-like protein (TIGR03299 family)
MAANIETFDDGTAAFVSNREIPWHKLGTVVDGALTAEEALQKAYLDSTVYVSEESVSTHVPLKENSDKKTNIKFDSKFLTYRYHPKTGEAEALGCVGNKYVPIQNTDAFNFLNMLADESGAVFETAGSLNKGRQVFMSMKFPETMKLAGGQDTLNMYLMATNSHDGSRSFSVAVTPIRVVCTNTVTLGLQKAISKVTLKHTSGATAKVQQARETLGMVFAYQEEFENEVERLLSTKFTTKQYQQFVTALVPDKPEASLRAENSREEVRQQMFSLWNADTQKNVAGTKWAAYNAVVEYADWFKPVRGGSKLGTNNSILRAERIVDGGVDGIKNRAYALLTN